MERHLHIICLDVPYPADFGGISDLFYKIKTLHQLGIKISLHCFESGRGEQPELTTYCEHVNYYPRQEGHKGFSHKLPYIVCSRSSKELLENLLQDEHPVLLEGVHCTFLLNDERFSGRSVFLRLHNIEYKYYRQLYRSERAIMDKIYYWHESILLRRYEKKIANRVFILCVSQRDAEAYRQEFGAARVQQVPVFLPFHAVQSKEGNGCYCLFHANLSVAENEKMVDWLLKEVFHGLNYPFVIAGKKPSARLKRAIAENGYACLVANPSEQETADMLAKAQINIFPSCTDENKEIRMLQSLLYGRHCLVKECGQLEHEMEPFVHIAPDAGAFRTLIGQLYTEPFGDREIQVRQRLLDERYNNEQSGNRLISLIWQA